MHALIRRKFDAVADHMAREAILGGTPHLGVAVRNLPGPADIIPGDRESGPGFLSEHNRNLHPENVGRHPFSATRAFRHRSRFKCRAKEQIVT